MKPVSASRSSTDPLSDYATADEAMKRLNVQRQTLYAYVSRGWIRSIRQPGLRQRLYLRDDLERLGARSRARAGHAAAAASAMNLGDPIVTTGITEITVDGPSYRGRFATQLAAEGYSFEAVCDLLWTGTLAGRHTFWPAARRQPASVDGFVSFDPCPPARLIDAFVMTTLRLGASVGECDSATVANRVSTARDLLSALVESLRLWQSADATGGKGGDSLAGRVVSGLSLADTQVHRDVVNHVLILLADHELAPGTLVARVAASGGATLYHCVASALCASSGSQVAQVYARVDAFLEGAVTKTALLRRATRLQQSGAMIPGFTHDLYPKGDPRARSLFDLARARLPMTARLDATLSFVDAMAEEMGLYPRHELALVTVCRALGLPDGIPASMLAIARTAGWIAHVHEQRRSRVLLRPRARFETDAAIVSAMPFDFTRIANQR